MTLDFDPFKPPPTSRKEMEILGEVQGLKAQIAQLIVLHDVDELDPKILMIIKQINLKLDELENKAVN